MQIIKINHTNLMSEVVTCDMVVEIATMIGMTQEQIETAAKQDLRNASKSVAKLTCAKLRTIVNKKLQDSQEYGDMFKGTGVEIEFACLPDLEIEPDINTAGKNKSTPSGQRSGATGGKAAMVGPYTVVKCGLKCNVDTDPEKYAMWQFVWSCKSFEEFFAKAPKKAITRTGRIISASSEISWALKSGWIKPVAAE